MLRVGLERTRTSGGRRDRSKIQKARDLDAWLSLMPRERSTGGKQLLLGTSKRGNRYVRKLLLHSARSCFRYLDRRAAKEAQLREAGYIYAAGIVISDVTHLRTDGADHTFLQEPCEVRRYQASTRPAASSSVFTHFATETSVPPQLAYQLQNVASEIPCLRQRFAVFVPGSCSRRTPRIGTAVPERRSSTSSGQGQQDSGGLPGAFIANTLPR